MPSRYPAADARHVVRRILAALLLLLVLLAAWTAWALLASRSDLDRGRSALERATGSGASADSTAQLSARLASAEGHLRAAQRRLDALGPRLFRHVPVLGRTPAAASAATDAALAATRAGRQVLAATSGAPLAGGGGVDPAALARISTTLRAAAQSVQRPIDRLRSAPTSWTAPQVSGGVITARDRLHDLPDRLRAAADGVDAVTGIVGSQRSRHLLLLLENNAELRGTGGLSTVFAEATAQNGRIQLGRFRDVEEVAAGPAKAVRVPAPADYVRLWGPYLGNSTLWKNANMSPDVPTSSVVVAEVAARTLHRRPDAVIWLDARSFAEIIGATGPADLPDGSRLTRRSTLRVLLSSAYGGVADTRAGQSKRRARLRAAADVVAHRLLSGQTDSGPLAAALVRAAQGRHIALWSADPAEQRGLVQAGAAGDVSAGSGDLVSAVVQNFGGGDREGNKLDYYARRLVSVRVRLGKHTADVTQEVTLRNTAPAKGLPAYVAGRAMPGTSNNFLTLAAPSRATLLSFTRGNVAVHTDVLPEGDHQVVSDVVSLPPGTSVTWRLHYRLPVGAGGYTLRLVPQPLAVDAGLNVQISGTGGRVSTAGGKVGDLRLSGAFEDQQKVVAVRAKQGRLSRALDAVRRFWREPVHLPF